MIDFCDIQALDSLEIFDQGSDSRFLIKVCDHGVS